MKKTKALNGVEMITRENTLDEFVINERCYDKVVFFEKDIVLDIGANIGAFCCKYFNSVKRIISFEPESLGKSWTTIVTANK